MADPRFKYRITAQDDTAKGVGSAQKRLGTLEKAGKRYQSTLEKVGGRSPLSRATATFSDVHTSAFKALGGGSSPLGQITERLGAMREAAGAARIGLAAAAEEGGLLSGTLGTLGVVAGGTVGVLLAAGLAGYKFASGWVSGGAALGRLSQQLGMTTDDIQKFQTAGERFGVDKDQMAGALGGAGSTMHEAIYGRNNEALAAMNQLGIQIKRGADGRPDSNAMMMDLADAIAKQKDPYTQSRIAGIFGVTAALPLLRQGRSGVQAELNDAGRHGAIMTVGDTTDATRIQKTGVMAKQAGERLMQAGQGATARTETAHVNDAALAAARAAIDGTASAPRVGEIAHNMGDGVARFSQVVVEHVAPAARTMEHAAVLMLGASEAMAAETSHLPQARLDRYAHEGAPAAEYFRGRGWSAAQAAGIAANLARESGLNPRAVGDAGTAYGIGQWHPDRQAAFRRWAGHDLRQATLGEQLGFVNHELTTGADRGARAAGDLLRGVGGAGAAGSIVSRHYERPGDTAGEATIRAAIAEAIANHPQRIVVEVHGLPRGAHARARSRTSSGVAIGNAMGGTVP